MENISIQSDVLKLTLSPAGAELLSVKHLAQETEFIWNADPDVWNRHAPILFPIVGKLNQNKLLTNGNAYTMGQHGFARDQVFEPTEIYTDLVNFMLSETDVSLTVYPYPFRLLVTYAVKNNRLEITYTVYNTGDSMMPFSIGAHPGFLLPESDLNQYVIEFEKEEKLERHLLSDGLFNGKTETLIALGKRFDLNKDSFAKDALVFKNLQSKSLNLKHKNSNWAVRMAFDGFPYFGIWAKHPTQDFICLEPWQGLADAVGFEGEMRDKEGIISLKPGESKSLTYSIEFTPCL